MCSLRNLSMQLKELFSMKEQILSDDERKNIRSKLYSSTYLEPIQFSDRKISYFTSRTKNKIVLDLGCIDHHPDNWRSKFWMHRAIKQVAKKVIGLDYYQHGVEILNKEGFDIVYGDAQNFQFEKKFDIVTAGDLIEHLPNLEGFFKSVHCCLHENGFFVLSTPNPWCWKYVAYHIWHGKLTPMNKEHVAWICLQQFYNLGERYGFEVINFEYCSRRKYENLIPFPARIKHTTLNITLRKK
jgi:SAM-dependent methyltransferase